MTDVHYTIRPVEGREKRCNFVLFDSINIRTHNISNTIVDYYMCTCVNMAQVP